MSDGSVNQKLLTTHCCLDSCLCGIRSQRPAPSRLAVEAFWAADQVPSQRRKRLQPMWCAVRLEEGFRSRLALALPGLPLGVRPLSSQFCSVVFHKHHIYNRAYREHCACMCTGRSTGGRTVRGGRAGPAPASSFPVGQPQPGDGATTPGGSQFGGAAGGLFPTARTRSPGEGGTGVRKSRLLGASAGQGRAAVRGSPLFNIMGHLGVGGAEARRSPRRMQREEVETDQPAAEQVHHVLHASVTVA